MFFLMPRILTFLELIKSVPAGTSKTQVMLQAGGIGCADGGHGRVHAHVAHGRAAPPRRESRAGGYHVRLSRRWRVGGVCVCRPRGARRREPVAERRRRRATARRDPTQEDSSSFLSADFPAPAATSDAGAFA